MRTSSNRVTRPLFSHLPARPTRMIRIPILLLSLTFLTPTLAAPEKNPDFSHRKARIAVIGGGGAGVTAAYLMEQTHEVTLFEKSDRLGGDANTVNIPLPDPENSSQLKNYPIDAGFEFINAPGFPYFLGLLRMLRVETRPFQLTTTFTSPEGRSFLVTPVRKEGIFWGSILNPRNLFDLLRMKSFFGKAQKFVDKKTENQADAQDLEDITLDQYIASQNLNTRFRDEFLLPFLSSGWGVTTDEMKTWSAESIFRTILTETDGVSAPTWLEIKGGTATYIHAAEEQAKNLRVLRRANITSIYWDEGVRAYAVQLGEPSPEHQNTQSISLVAKDKEETDSPAQYSSDSIEAVREVLRPEVQGNSVEYFDAIVFATPAHQMNHLLKDLPFPEVVKVRDALAKVRYYDSRLIIHGDRSFMPANEGHWSVINVRSNKDGTQSGMSMCKRWRSPPNYPVFKTWVLEGDLQEGQLPENLYAEAKYQHRVIDLNFVKSKEAVREFEDAYGLVIAGAGTEGDRHENAIRSAIRATQKLAPQSERLKNLLKSVRGNSLR